MNASRDPVALAIVEQQLERRARAVAEHVDGALQGVIAQPLTAHGREPIDAFAKIHRRRSEKDAALGRELEHQSRSKKARTTAARGSGASCERIQRRAPSARCSSISVCGGAGGQAEGAGTSTKPPVAGGGSAQ